MSYFNSTESEQRHREAKKRSAETVKRRNRERYYNNPSYCGNCNKQLSYEQRRNKYCNHSCAATFNNKGVRRYGTSNNKHCLWCDGKLQKGAKKYCCSDCQKEYQYNIYINRWKLGLESGVQGKTGTSQYIRRYLFEKYDSKCQKCGWNMENPYTGRIHLQMHHIDGDFTNNNETNLELLCANCHTLTDNFGVYNRNNSTRVERYSTVA